LALEIQPKNLQKETEEWEFCEAQLPILLLCCWQQGPLAVCLGEPPEFFFAGWKVWTGKVVSPVSLKGGETLYF
jgi:hypothetical protein